MSEEKREAGEALAACAEQLSAATGALLDALGKLEAQYEALNQKVDRIVAAVESGELQANSECADDRIAELERENAALQVEAQRSSRKTLPAIVTSLLAKSGQEGGQVDGASLEKALHVLSVEQRIAVKAELARAGMLD